MGKSQGGLKAATKALRIHVNSASHQQPHLYQLKTEQLSWDM